MSRLSIGTRATSVPPRVPAAARSRPQTFHKLSQVPIVMRDIFSLEFMSVVTLFPDSFGDPGAPIHLTTLGAPGTGPDRP
ncbi:hypothetical protein GCM10009566_46000 [Streptomyces murinus]